MSKTKPTPEVFKCSKCPKGDNNTFKNRADFYVHVLECGGELDWDSSKKKSKKKKKVSATKRSNSTEVSAGKFILLFFINLQDFEKAGSAEAVKI